MVNKIERRGRKFTIFGRIRQVRTGIAKEGGVVVNLTVPHELVAWAKAMAARKEIQSRFIGYKILLVYAMMIGSQGIEGAVLEELAKQRKA